MWKCRFLPSKMLFFFPSSNPIAVLVFLDIFFKVIPGKGEKEKMLIKWNWDDFVILQSNSTLKWKSDWLRVRKDL